VKTSPKRSYSVIKNERFGLVFAKTKSIISGTVGVVPPGHHELLQQSIIKDGGLLFQILVEAFDEKSQSGQPKQ
jgi:hypothetical protein